MVDDTTHFSVARLVEPLTTESVLETILALWVAVYTVLQNTLVYDDGSQFKYAFGETLQDA